MMMDNRLEEIRKRDAQEIEAADMWIHHYTACSDRRWLLGEVGHGCSSIILICARMESILFLQASTISLIPSN